MSQDSLGSTSHIANASGQLLESYRYNLYGEPTYWNASGAQMSNSAHGVVDLFAGERWLPELGLYDDRNRFMSPELGRFLQPDPIGFKGDSSNLYRYCGNDWANRSDPMGLDPEFWLIRDYMPNAASNPFRQRDAAGDLYVKNKGKYEHISRTNVNGYQDGHGIRKGDYTLQPKGNSWGKGSYPPSQPAVTGTEPGLRPGQPNNSYTNAPALVHGNGVPGQPDSRACVTVDSQKVPRVQKIMEENGNKVPFHIREPERAQPVKSNNLSVGLMDFRAQGVGGALTRGQQEMANGNYGAYDTNTTQGSRSFATDDGNGNLEGTMMSRIPPSLF